MGLEVILLPEELKQKDITNTLVVVIDVLRASSTITTALAEGANSITPVYSPQKARERIESSNYKEALLGGERKGERLPGFDLGNSPLEYKNNIIQGKNIILTTTNGVRTMEIVQDAQEIIVGCFLNVQAVADYCLSYPNDILIACAGDRGNVSLEDTVCAGMILELYDNKKERKKYQYDDSLIATQMYKKYSLNLFKIMKDSIWGKHLLQIGLEKDLVYCAQRDIYKHIPVIVDGSIVVKK